MMVDSACAEKGGGGWNDPLVHFLEKLEAIQTIRSVDEERKVAEWAEELIPHLQKNRSTIAEDRLARIEYYRLVLEGVLRRCTMQLEEAAIHQLFLVSGDLELTAQSLAVLTVFTGRPDFDVKLHLLGKLFADDTVIPAALVDGGRVSAGSSNGSLSAITRDLTKDRFVTRLVNVPTVIANYAAGIKATAPFVEHYEKLLYRNILKASLVMARINNDSSDQQRFSYDLLGKLLSRVIMNFSTNRSSAALESYLKIICLICNRHPQHDDDNDTGESLKASITELWAKVNSCQAIETLFMCLLNKCFNWRAVLSPELLQLSSDWKYVVTKGIPLRSYVRDHGFPRVFVQFLVQCEEREECIEEILLELLNCWSQNGVDRALDQHIFISRLIILLILALQRRDTQMDQKLSAEVKKRIYNGMSAHLQSLDMNLRFVGMRMAEIVLNILESVPEEDRLDFGAAKLNVNRVVQEMFEGFEEMEDKVPVDSDVDDDGILMGLEVVDQKDESRIKEQTLEPAKQRHTNFIEEPLDSDDDEAPLDEDDDLVPYDLSNDTSEQEVVSPKYLLDLKEVLLQSTDNKNNAEQFQAAVKVCADLIRNQLPLNDARLGVELLSILITLTNKVYNEHFVEQRFEGCVAVVEVIPKQAAEFLCDEFYADAGRYAISHRVLMLEVLSEAARRLSVLVRKDSKQVVDKKGQALLDYKKLTVKDLAVERRKEINKTIADRLAEKTRRFVNGPSGDPVSGINRFHDVAGSFIFPLIHGFGSKQFLFKSRSHLKDDTTNVLLLSFLKTLCVLTLASENAPGIRRILQEELHLIVLLKFYAEERIQMALLELIGCVMTVTPKQMMATEFLQSFLEIKAWLEDLVERNAFNPDMKKDSRELAQRLLSFL